jgi:hypothetical protein
MFGTNYESLVAALEYHSELRGKRTLDVPKLAAFRVHYRRVFYRQANVFLALGILNVILATIVPGALRYLNAACAGLMVWQMAVAEERARRMTRQLNRQASVQVARDLFGLDD